MRLSDNTSSVTAIFNYNNKSCYWVYDIQPFLALRDSQLAPDFFVFSTNGKSNEKGLTSCLSEKHLCASKSIMQNGQKVLIWQLDKSMKASLFLLFFLKPVKYTSNVAVLSKKRQHFPLSGMISKDEFHHEIKTMKTIQHANVVQVYGFCTMEQPYCIVTEYLPYLDLKEYLISGEYSQTRNYFET